MAFVPIPLTAEVALRQEYSGEDVVNIMYFRSSGQDWTEQQLQNLCDVVENWWRVVVRPNRVNELSLREVYARQMSVQNGVFAVTPSAATGQIVDEIGVPANVALAVAFRTGLVGRSFRGRNFITGFPTPYVQNNTFVSSATADTFAAQYRALATTLAGDGVDHVVVSRVANGVVRTVGVTTVVREYTCDVNLDSMRRRLAGRGT